MRACVRARARTCRCVCAFRTAISVAPSSWATLCAVVPDGERYNCHWASRQCLDSVRVRTRVCVCASEIDRARDGDCENMIWWLKGLRRSTGGGWGIPQLGWGGATRQRNGAEVLPQQNHRAPAALQYGHTPVHIHRTSPGVPGSGACCPASGPWGSGVGKHTTWQRSPDSPEQGGSPPRKGVPFYCTAPAHDGWWGCAAESRWCNRPLPRPVRQERGDVKAGRKVGAGSPLRALGLSIIWEDQFPHIP